jgi:hypothetical protein
MGHEFLDVVLGQDASATSCGTGMPPVESCKRRSAESVNDLLIQDRNASLVFVRVIN